MKAHLQKQQHYQRMCQERRRVFDAIQAKAWRWHKLAVEIAVERANKKRHATRRWSSTWTGADEQRYFVAHAELAPQFEPDIERLKRKRDRQDEAIAAFRRKHRPNNHCP